MEKQNLVARNRRADIILQVAEKDSNRTDCRADGHEYLIGRTRLGCGIALVFGQILDGDVLYIILDENEKAKAKHPVHIYATACTAPIDDDLYRFHQISNSI